jgi:predicted ABC-type ATPase
MSKSPTISVVAGPNGAGKTTFVENYLNRYVDCDEFLNADLIATGLSPFAPERQNLKASELFLTRLSELEQGEQSFALETTLSGLSYRRRIPIWHQLGFKVTLLFLWLPSADIAVQRVRERVSQGGHNIPEPDIRRRYIRGLQNLTTVYLPLVSEAWVLNGSQSPPTAILKKNEGGPQILEPDIWQEIMQIGKGQT